MNNSLMKIYIVTERDRRVLSWNCYSVQPNDLFQSIYLLQISTELDVINTTIYYAATRKLRHTETLKLCEAIIYYATVERETVILKVSIYTHHIYK